MGAYLGLSHIRAVLVINDAPVAEVSGSTVAIPAGVKGRSDAATLVGFGSLWRSAFG
jgi:hypothetical protein